MTGSGSTPATPAATSSPRTTTRCWPSSACGRRTGRRCWPAPLRRVDGYVIEGPKVNLPFFTRLLADPDFVSGDVRHGLVAAMSQRKA